MFFMNHFTNQSNGSHRGRMNNGGAIIRRFALFSLMLLMLLLLPDGMMAQKTAYRSNYIATYNSTTKTLTFRKYTDKRLPNMSAWVQDGMIVGNMIGSNSPLGNIDVKHIVFDQSFSTFTPTTLNKFFYNLFLLETIQGLEYLNTTNVTDMSYMFSGCVSIQRISAAKIKTEKVTNMEYMFQSCQTLTSLDLSNFNTEKVTNMKGMFRKSVNLEAIIASDKFVTNAVTASDNMFEDCKALYGDIEFTPDKAADKTYAKIDGGYFRMAGVEDRSWAEYADGTLTFRYGYKKIWGENEYALNSGVNPPAWETNQKNISRVVFEASFTNARPTSCYAWFRDFSHLKQIEGMENLNTAKVTDMSYMFTRCSELAELDVTHFNTANVTDMRYMFSDCSNLAELDVTHFNTANVKDMSSMFSDCSNLAKLDVTHFNTAKVTDMSYMFTRCSELTELDVTHFNTANVKGMSSMFSGCSNLTELDLTHFNTAIVTTMFGMFNACKSLTTIYVSDDFVIDKITNKTYSLFSGCIKLKGATEYNKNNTDYRFANYKTGYFTKLVGKNGDEKIGATGETLTAENLVFEDGKDFVAYEPFAAKAASYSRTVEGTTWATLCLPFEVSLQNQNFRAFKLLSADDADETVELEEIKTSIEAGTPVIIKMNEGATLLSFSEADKEITNEVKIAETANSNYQLQGLYTQKVFSKDTDNNCYIVKGDKLMNPAKLLEKTATEFVGSKPFRAYMVDNSSAPVAGARMFSIRIGDGTTAIKQLEADAADGKAEYYDLQGHRLQDLQKGVNIVKRGGKTMKVIIK